MAKRRVQLMAVQVEALCPYCGEPQPNKEGSHLWTSDEIKAQESSEHKCVSCDEKMWFFMDTKVQFEVSQ